MGSGSSKLCFVSVFLLFIYLPIYLFIYLLPSRQSASINFEILASSGLNEDEEDEEDAGEWNEADFEVIEMNDTLRNSVVETSLKAAGDSSSEASLQPHPADAGGDFPVAAGSSPGRKSMNVDREKND